ncbi:hypothetical protein [Pseudonocardia sp. WMMC193]|uniref:hypothetical protein n=1 Tax=Pseudonocardia sp. WMMC193 TaxID=2911965 RepID=UPI001F3DAAE0|nr:hypothetical protein [Pseudonocardia sp. WMMC193]MCF7547899.1 hypothetical protein [Pseudonocardia sp. WMMC193]
MLLVDDHAGEVRCVASRHGLRIAVTDSVSFLTPDLAGHLVVTGSHGGTSAGEYARRCGVAAVACNDAGIGKDRAGVAGLLALDDAGVLGVAVSHDSARIGDGTDTWENGLISVANASAIAAGVVLGNPLRREFLALVERLSGGLAAC